MISKQSVHEVRMFTVNALTWDYGLNMGHVLPITACLHPKNKYGNFLEMNILGTMGVQMRDSIRNAASLARQTMAAKTRGFMYHDNELVISIPNNPNFMYDGPSAGLAAYTAVLGTMLGWKANPMAAMTGELLENGSIIKVRAVPLKIEMAQRHDIHTVFIPRDNMNDIHSAHPKTDLPMQVLGVSQIDQIEVLASNLPDEVSQEKEEKEHVEIS